jgi:putative CocE/NonD family hydrolase
MSGGQVNTAFIPLWLGLVSSTSILPPTYTASDPVRATTTVIGHAGGVTNFQSNTLTSSITGGDVAYDGPFSRQRSPIEQIDKIKVPAFVVGGLHDLFQRGEPLIYERLKTRVNAKLLIGNWTHGDFGSGLPADGVPNLNQIALRWFDQYLKGMNTDVNSMPSVTQYVLGENRFEVQSDWPLPQTTVKNYYLRSNQLLADSAPNSPEKTDSMLQQPVCGVCSGSTNQWLIGTMGATPCAKDNRLTELSEITYTTPTLTKDLKLSGPIGAEIFVTTSAKDAVLSVRLTDVSPDGTSTELTAGWLAASLRQVDNVKSRIKQGYNLQPWHPFTRDSILPVLAGEPMKLNIEIFPTNAVIKAGHKLRVAVGPSDFPHAVSPVPAQTNQLGGVVNILHDDAHPSFVSLPVVR